MSSGGSTKVIILSLCANLGIAVSKLAGALFTGSSALMAEAVHSFSDCGNQALLLWGGFVAKKPPTRKFPLGRGKEMFFWSFAVALLLFSIGGAFSMYEGIHKLQEPTPISHPYVGIVILVIAVGLESVSFFACLKEVRAQYPKGSLWRWVRQTMAADLLVIFLEDLAALFGLVLALAALVMSWITGNPLWDALGSCAVGVLLIVVALVLAKEVKSMLIGEAPAEDYEEELKPLLAAHFPQGRMLRFIAIQQGVGAVIFAYKIHPGNLTQDTQTSIESVNRFEASVRERFPEVQWQFAELDVKE